MHQALARVLVGAIAGDDVSVNEHTIAVSQQTLIPVLMDVAIADDDVVGVVELDAIPAVADFKPFDSNPADGILIALLRLKQHGMAGRLFAPLAGLNHRPLAGIVFEHDRLALLPGESQNHRLGVDATSNQNRIPRTGQARGLLNRAQRLRLAARILIASVRRYRKPSEAPGVGRSGTS